MSKRSEELEEKYRALQAALKSGGEIAISMALYEADKASENARKGIDIAVMKTFMEIALSKIESKK